MVDAPKNIAASINRRLLNYSREIGADPNLVLVWYGLERLLYRLSLSPLADRFVLKGAMLFRLWDGDTFRATRDLDLLSFIRAEASTVTAAFRTICQQQVPDDGVVFDPSSMQVEPILEQQEYGGLRVRVAGKLGNARLSLRIDVGFGDAITPAAFDASYPTLLGMPAPKIRVYPKETVIAEKFEAMVTRAMTNTRMKDYYDIWTLARRHVIDPIVLATAIRATFERRQIALPRETPVGLTAEYSRDPAHQSQWRAFVTRNLHELELQDEFERVVKDIAGYLMPIVLDAVGKAD